MSSSKDFPDPSDVLLNRYNLWLAQSRKVLQSWLPANTSPAAAEVDVEDDFKAMGEGGGISSKRAYGDDHDDALSVARQTRSTTDAKLLVQLLGKKAAQAHKKSMEAQSAASTSKKPPSTGRPAAGSKVQTAADSDDDEETGGRASAFASRASKDASARPDGDEQAASHGDSEEPGPDSLPQDHEQSTAGLRADSKPQAPPAKRKAASYLDEILAQKANKRKKKKKKAGPSSD